MNDNPIIIRAVTLGAPLEALGPERWRLMSSFYQKADELFTQAEMIIRTRRLVLEPLTPQHDMDSIRLRALLRSVRHNGKDCGIRWFCLPISASDDWRREDLRLLGPTLLNEEPSLFLHYLLAHDGKIYANSFPQLARIILDIARLSNNGFDNFRVGAGANIVANTPFFPFSRHEGTPGFALAVESLDPLLTVLENTRDIPDWNDSPAYLLDHLTTLCRAVNTVGLELEAVLDGAFRYKGMDISLAPYPDDKHSIALLMERLGLHMFGGLGTAACTFFLTRLLKNALAASGARVTGFNGVMFSPLEDKGLAQRLRNDDLQVEHFMLWSTLCGCGVDMLPIEGTTRPDSIAALYSDVCALSCKHAKPLGVRILPVPGGRINETTRFNHDFFFNCRIAGIRGGMDNSAQMEML